MVAAASAGSAASGWVVVASPNQAGVNSLGSVSCTSSTSCVAVGGSENEITGAVQTLIESWDGSTWSVVPSPNPGAGPYSMLSGVSCVSATSCMAVGSTSGDGSQHALIEWWNGTVWSILPSPSTGTDDDVLSAVSCTSSVRCVAVGNDDVVTRNRYQALIETWNGSTWSATPSPEQGTETNILSGVSCASATSCVAVGTYQSKTTQKFQGLIDSWDGSTWSVTAGPVVSAAHDNHLYGVSCSSATTCMAVGFTTAGYQLVSESWNGSAWSIVAAPKKGTHRIDFAGVSCSASTSCVAVGYSQSAALVSRALLETWNGLSWQVTASPNQNTAADALTGVTCVTASACVAVGSGPKGTLIETGPA